MEINSIFNSEIASLLEEYQKLDIFLIYFYLAITALQQRTHTLASSRPETWTSGASPSLFRSIVNDKGSPTCQRLSFHSSLARSSSRNISPTIFRLWLLSPGNRQSDCENEKGRIIVGSRCSIWINGANPYYNNIEKIYISSVSSKLIIL